MGSHELAQLVISDSVWQSNANRSKGLKARDANYPGLFYGIFLMESKRTFGEKKRMWLYFGVALGVSAVACLVISLLTMDGKTLKAVSNIKAFYFVIVGLLVVGRWLCECFRFRLITKTMGKDISFGRTSKAVLGSAFAGAITPYRSGGFPAQVFFLSRYGLSGGEATAVSTAAGAVSAVVMVMSFSAVIFLGAAKFRINMGARTALILVGIISVVGLILALSQIRKPSRTIRFLNRVTPRFLRKKDSFARFEERLEANLCDFTNSMRRFIRGRKHHIFLVFVLTVVFWFSQAVVVSFILRGFGYPQYFWKAMMGQIIVSSILPFAPVPGESGVAEVAFAGIFSVFINKNTVGLVTMAWRFFMLYFPMLILALAFILALKDVKVCGKNVAPSG